jgi:hypothetical protein
MKMKQLLNIGLLAGLLFTISELSAQTHKPSNCLTEWEDAFKARGAEPIKEGKHEDVIVALCDGKDECKCYTGTALIKDKYVAEIGIKTNDGKVVPISIDAVQMPLYGGGMSKPFVTMVDGSSKKVVVIFQKTLKSKKVEYIEAPRPN